MAASTQGRDLLLHCRVETSRQPGTRGRKRKSAALEGRGSGQADMPEPAAKVTRTSETQVEEIMMDPEKVATIMQWSVPFLGTAGYYERLTHQYAHLTAL